MTSRQSIGNIQYQPERSISNTGMIQKPPPLRALSRQYHPSPSTKRNENYVDLTLEGPESVHGRCAENDGSATTPSRISGSRLKLEVSRDLNDAAQHNGSPNPHECPQESQLHHPVSRGRPKFQLEGNRPQLQGVSDASLLSSIRGGENITAQMPLPMPRRPSQNARCSPRERAPPSSVLKKDVRPKPYILEVPSAAPRCPPNGFADFFPWTGDHPEDLFTDNVIKQGYFDKIQTTQNETGSAKSSIFPALKHKSGLQTLSSLFTNVLFQRRAHGQITATPTFKPPPRVTLTDTKRESWLRDLANPSISLRRLSRTIPHGIRGRVLLEQCLNKNIPTERAVWLAKCVGANEIRSFKRKGVTGTFPMGGEAKWIRDWTAFVEQFVESIVASCGDKDWKQRVLYVVRLAAHLYAEHLLDRDHYMDWLSASLETCPLVKAPIWLLITQVYWKDLLKYRKYGRRLVAALSAHLHTAHEDPDKDLLLPLTDRMTYILCELMATYPENFISPRLWSKYKKTLEFYTSQATNFSAIDRRNSYLSPHGVKGGQSPRHQLIQFLDRSITQPFSNDLPDNCWHVMIDRPTLIRTTLEWSSSSHRPGLAKVYVTSRLLRIWSGSGINVNSEILSFAGSEINSLSFCRSSFYHVVSELTRSGHFSISRYLQWLIARGGVRGTSDLMEDGPCATRLLAELPTNDLPDSISRLRRTLLGRASFPLDEELEQTRKQIAIIENYFQSLTTDTGPNTDLTNLSAPVDMASDGPKLSRAIKSEIGIWLREYVNLRTVKCVLPPMANWKDDDMGEVKSAITSSEFILVRRFLEDVEDLSILADVLEMVSSSDDIHVLASAVDTLSFHIEAFAAIGALKDLFDRLLTRLSALRESQNSDCTPLLTSLADFAARLPGVEIVAFQLSQEVTQNSRKPVADVCSPVSDNMAEALQSSESDFPDEIEKVLASGTFMDQSTLERLFEMIIFRIEVSWNKDAVQQRSCALLLGQLRIFNPKKSDALITSWLRRLFQSSRRPAISYILGPLIALGCLGFKEVLASSVAILDSDTASSETLGAPGIAIETLTLLVGSSQKPNNMLPDDFYHLGVKRLQAQKNFPVESISIVRRAIESSVFLVENQQGMLETLCYSERMRSFLQYLILIDLDTIVQGLIMPLAKSSHPEVYDRLSALINYLLNHTSGVITKSGVHSQTLASRIENAFQLADELALPFCQLELQYIFAAEVPDYSNDEKFGAKCLEAFERAVDSAVASDNRAWMSIIPKLNVQIARHLCQRAERLFLQLVPSVKSEDPNALSSRENEDLARRLLFIINAMRYSIQSNRTLHLASQVVEKLNDLWQIAFQGGEPSQSIVMMWLPLLLEFIILHINMFDSTKSGSDLRSRVLLSLSTLFLELHTCSDISVLTQQTFDVALLLVDDLPEDARIHCVRSLRDRTSNSTVRYIFGYSAPPMDWLQLSQKGKLVLHTLRRWEILSEPTPNVGENDTSLSLTLFKSRKL